MKKAILLMAMLVLSFLGFAQVSKQQAIQIVMESVVGNDSTVVNVYMSPSIRTDSYIVINYQDSISSPFNSYWLFFIDDMPNFMWGHRCRYLLIQDQHNMISVEKRLPPLNRDLIEESVSISVIQEKAEYNATTIKDNNYSNRINNDGKYAVLLCGGEVPVDDPINLWNALSHMYCGLLEQGYKKENIYVMSCDGDSINPYSNPSLDLDKDEEHDVDILPYPCSLDSVISLFSNLSNLLCEEDLLYVFVATHGDTINSNGNVGFLLWEQEILPDTIFAELLSNIHCSQIILNLYSCYSGGFLDDLINSVDEKISIITSTLPNMPYFRTMARVLGMDRFCYLSCSALRNYYPIIGSPWDTCCKIGNNSNFYVLFGEDEIDYDLNANGIYNIGETFQYVQQYECNQGMFYDFHGFKDDLLCLNGIMGKVESIDTVRGVYHIEDALSICAESLILEDFSKFYLFDADLIIEDTASLIMGDTAAIIARSGDCRVIVKGNLTLGNGVTFEARDGATLDIIFENDVDLAISNATFINCTLELPKRNLSFNDCRFIGTPLEMNNASDQSSEIDKMASVINCEFSPNGNNINNALYIKNFAQYKVNGCKIEANDGGIFKNGIAIYNCGSNLGLEQVHGNDVSGCLQSGIQMYASSGNITMNTVYGNGYGIKLLNNCNISSLSGNCGATLESDTQFIHDNTNNEIYMTGSSIPQRFRYNAIHHNGNIPYVNHDAYIAFGNENRGSIDVKYNYWGNGFTPSTHLHTNLIGGEYVYNPEWILGNCYNNWADAAMMLNEADSLNVAGAYWDAQIMYKQVVENYPESVSAETALKSLLVLEAQYGGEYLSLKEYYLTNNTIAADETLSHLASSLANKCDEKMENFTEAISWYEEILTSPETSFNDSIFAAIDLGDLYLRLGEDGEKGVCGKLEQYKPESKEVHRIQTERALSLLPSEKSFGNKQRPFPVSELNIQVGENDSVFLSWNLPEGITEARLSWSNEKIDDVLFSPGGVVEQVGANRFEPSDLEPFVGWTIKDISYVPWSPSNQTTHYGIRIWTGNMDNLVLIYDQPTIEYVAEQWNTYSVEDNIVINEGTEYWIGGYAITSSLILGVNTGNVVPWKSDLWRTNNMNWYSLYEQGIRANFCISATLVSSEGYNKEQGQIIDDVLTAYRVYRDGELIKEIPYTFQTSYTDLEFSKGIDMEYCVTAVYGEEESEPVCATASITGVAEEHGNDGVTVLPNPTNGHVHIAGAGAAEVMVYNAIGQLVKTVQDTNEIDLKGLPKGMYLLRIINENGAIATKKVMVE